MDLDFDPGGDLGSDLDLLSTWNHGAGRVPVSGLDVGYSVLHSIPLYVRRGRQTRLQARSQYDRASRACTGGKGWNLDCRLSRLLNHAGIDGGSWNLARGTNQPSNFPGQGGGMYSGIHWLWVDLVLAWRQKENRKIERCSIEAVEKVSTLPTPSRENRAGRGPRLRARQRFLSLANHRS